MADWARVRSVFEDALDVPSAERSAWLDEACEGDADLRAEVDALLANEEPEEDFLEPPRGAGMEAFMAEPSLEGRRLGGFEVVRTLGRGGMGVVYLAEQAHPRRHVALKLLEGFSTEEQRRRFQMEAEILGRLRHPNIAQVYASGDLTVEVTLPYFAMEYVEDARTLVEHVAAEELDLRARVALMRDVCDAVQHGHGMGILHRDLKPANILVGKDGRVKVIDFGIARALGEEDGRTRITSTGEFVGTLSYMAPERLVEGGAGDVRADVYSLGVVLYELFVGSRPFELRGLPLAEAIRCVIDTEPRAMGAELPVDLRWIVECAMAKEPERRYATAAALAEDLRRFLADEAVAASPPSASYRMRKYVRRHRAGVAASLVVLAVVIAAGARVRMSRLAEVEARDRAQGEAVKLLSLRDVLDLEALRQEEASFAPIPEEVPRMEAWLVRCEEMRSGLEDAERVLFDLESTGEGAREVDHWLGDSLRAHAEQLAPLFAPQGVYERVKEQRDYAANVYQQTIDGEVARLAWDEAVRSIADPEECPLYGGLVLTPQLGLLPLQRDSESGLWEFAHLRSGAAPAIDENGDYKLTSETGIVLVLIPGGTFTMGARLPEAGEAWGTPNVDPYAFPHEKILGERSLDPFFLSKYEWTQAQHERLLADNPSERRLPLAPVDRIDWHETMAVGLRLGLTLPTEAQWEFAVRAGTTTPFWCPDISCGTDNLIGIETVEVGGYPANPFGLHDLLGNVFEWCRDAPGKVDTAFSLGDGAWLKPGSDFRVRRGGSCRVGPGQEAMFARSAARWTQRSTQADHRCGARFSRAID